MTVSGDSSNRSESYTSLAPAPGAAWIRFDRNELAGAFGDIGTDLPLIIGMILAAGLHSSSVLVMFGLMQFITALTYGMPMPVQPLKAVAVLVITQKIAPEVLYGGGLAIGIVMLVLAATGAITWLARVVPRPVVRGLQLGLGIQLSLLALKDYVQADGMHGYVLAAISFVIIVALLGNRRFPPALFVIALGIAYAFVFKLTPHDLAGAAGFTLPHVRPVTLDSMIAGFTLLAIPQIPLSIGNSVLATRQAVEDLFPGRKIGVRKLSFTYAVMNLVNPFFGGVPTCHGSGGLVGHYTFGARTGGSIIIYGSLFLILGLFFASGFQQVVQVFPLPVLGVLLFFEGVALMLFARTEAGNKRDFFIVVATGVIANGLPYGYASALLLGTVLFYSAKSIFGESV
ncbi:MAG TPA: putative sulfate/molybdate transporter [Gemmatimonadaceae bacterium]|nr:putative sulfate/molybdate transporter [Gemmatimonadaceae bacterium]